MLSLRPSVAALARLSHRGRLPTRSVRHIAAVLRLSCCYRGVDNNELEDGGSGASGLEEGGSGGDDLGDNGSDAGKLGDSGFAAVAQGRSPSSLLLGTAPPSPVFLAEVDGCLHLRSHVKVVVGGGRRVRQSRRESRDGKMVGLAQPCCVGCYC